MDKKKALYTILDLIRHYDVTGTSAYTAIESIRETVISGIQVDNHLTVEERVEILENNHCAVAKFNGIMSEKMADIDHDREALRMAIDRVGAAAQSADSRCDSVVKNIDLIRKLNKARLSIHRETIIEMQKSFTEAYDGFCSRLNSLEEESQNAGQPIQMVNAEPEDTPPCLKCGAGSCNDCKHYVTGCKDIHCDSCEWTTFCNPRC